MIKKTLIKYAVSLTIAAVIVVLVLWMQGYFTQTEWRVQCKNLCDAFTVSGLVFILVSALVWVSNMGIFLGLGYAFSVFINSIVPFRGKRRHESYADYRERKTGKGGVKGYSFIFFTGLVYFVVAIVFLIIYYQLPA